MNGPDSGAAVSSQNESLRAEAVVGIRPQGHVHSSEAMRNTTGMSPNKPGAL